MEYAIAGASSRTSATEFLKAWRGGTLRCATCQQPIRGPQVVGGGRAAFHPSHAPRPAVASRAARPALAGTLVGSACSLNETHGLQPRGTTYRAHERFTPDCFDGSLHRGGQQLRLNHTSQIPGTFRRLAVDAGRVVFEFCVDGSPLGREVLGAVRAGDIKHCSIGFTTTRSRFDRATEVIQTATLVEISLLRGTSPALPSTWVAVA